MGGAGKVLSPPRGDVGRFVKHGFLTANENRIPVREGFDNQNEDHKGKNTGDSSIQALIEYEALSFGNFLGGNFPRSDLCCQDFGISKKTDARIDIEDFLVTRG